MAEFREITGPPRGGPEAGPRKKLSKNWLLIGGGVAILVVIYSYRKAKTATTTAPTDPSIDPNTGLPYGDSGTTPISGASGVTPSLYSFIDPATGQVISGTGGGAGHAQPTTNAEWFQIVEAYMIQIGYDPFTTAAALGKYLAGAQLTADQLALVQTAIAAEGNPPVAVPPPHTTPSGGQTNPITIPPPRGNFPPVAHHGLHRIGVVGKSYSWQSQATRFNTTVAVLKSLNPVISHAASIPGGYPLITPS